MNVKRPENLMLEIKDVGPIINANIEISKINIIGGQNSTGKSTASKLLYCFLRANSSNRQELATESLLNQISSGAIKLRRLCSHMDCDGDELWKINRHMRRHSILEEPKLEDLIEDYDILKAGFEKIRLNLESKEKDKINSVTFRKRLNRIHTEIDKIGKMIDIVKSDLMSFMY